VKGQKGKGKGKGRIRGKENNGWSKVMQNIATIFDPSDAFSALTLLVWLGIRKSIRPTKNWVMGYWRGYLSGVWYKWFAYGPANATATPSSLASVKSRMVCLSGAGLPRLSWKKGHVCVCVCLWPIKNSFCAFPASLYSHQKLDMYIYWFSSESSCRHRRRWRQRHRQRWMGQYNH